MTPGGHVSSVDLFYFCPGQKKKKTDHLFNFPFLQSYQAFKA